MRIVSLRPPGIWSEKTYSKIDWARKINPGYEWSPFWEYGSFIDIEDFTDLISILLQSDFKEEHKIYNACSDDITTSGKTSVELCTLIQPDIKWKNISPFKNDPFKSILCNDKIKKDFNWKPERSWRNYRGDIDIHKKV